MEKGALLFAVVLLLLSLQLFDYSLNKPQLPSTIPITGAAVSESQTTPCAEASPCKSPTSWKCQSNSRCYDYSDCLFQCPSTPSSEKKDEQQPGQACTCSDWQTTGGCGEQSCPSGKVPQSKSCTGGSTCKTENRCVESDQCKKAVQLPTQKCVDYLCIEDSPGVQYCSYKCTIDAKRYESSECEQKCGETEKAATSDGANLVPELTVTLPQGRTTMKGGEKIKVLLKVKNAGNKDADISGIKSGTSFKNIIYFYKNREFGDLAIDTIIADFSLAQAKILAGGSEVAIAEREVTVPTGFSGTLVIAAVVDSQDNYRETPLGETDNRQARQITVEFAQAAMPNLVPATAQSLPSLEKLSVTEVTVQSVQVEVQNKGNADAVAQQQFLEVHATIRQGSTVVCTQVVPDRRLVTIKPGLLEVFSVDVRSSDNANLCVLTNPNANYWADIKVDPAGVVAESDENDNVKTFQLKGPQKCPELGKREGTQYCSITEGEWLTQKKAGNACNHNFECETDLCVKNKCVTEAQKEQILKIVP